MEKHAIFTPMLFAAALTTFGTGAAGAPPGKPAADADAIVARVVQVDPWGLSGADVSARVTVTERSGRTRVLAFEAKSRRHAPSLAKSLITFRAPADVSGMKFLQIQNRDADDERFLYTPELRRSRRIAGSTRGESFMGTDFTYADLDGRDLRRSAARLEGDERVGRFDCHHLVVRPRSPDAIYGKIELWVRKDDDVPVRWVMFDKPGSAPVKTLQARELRRVGGHWFITRSQMTDHATGRSTELVLERVDRREEAPADEFTVRAMEKG